LSTSTTTDVASSFEGLGEVVPFADPKAVVVLPDGSDHLVVVRGLDVLVSA
jgi:hypothetical protein